MLPVTLLNPASELMTSSKTSQKPSVSVSGTSVPVVVSPPSNGKPLPPPPQAARAPAAKRGALVDHDGAHDEVVDVDVALVLSVGDGGHEEFEELARTGAVEEAEAVDRLGDGLAADHVGDDAKLPRRNAHVAKLGGGCVGIGHVRVQPFLPLRSAA